MKKETIIQLLPYQAPFLFVEELTYISEDRSEGYYTFKNDEYFYLGHFKDNPLTPGVILTEVMAQIGVVCLGIYLLKKFPGRWDNKKLLVESSNLELKDGVSSVILGFNDWASAWALDKSNNPIYPIVPGGERQREIAYRFGINIVMYALTGNYKSDQVHYKSILNRLNNNR